MLQNYIYVDGSAHWSTAHRYYVLAALFVSMESSDRLALSTHLDAEIRTHPLKSGFAEPKGFYIDRVLKQRVFDILVCCGAKVGYAVIDKDRVHTAVNTLRLGRDVDKLDTFLLGSVVCSIFGNDFTDSTPIKVVVDGALSLNSAALADYLDVRLRRQLCFASNVDVHGDSSPMHPFLVSTDYVATTLWAKFNRTAFGPDYTSLRQILMTQLLVPRRQFGI